MDPDSWARRTPEFDAIQAEGEQLRRELTDLNDQLAKRWRPPNQILFAADREARPALIAAWHDETDEIVARITAVAQRAAVLAERRRQLAIQDAADAWGGEPPTDN